MIHVKHCGYGDSRETFYTRVKLFVSRETLVP